ncbi:hypothetical protein [uncultured Sphingomonas sp.]|uniref:hypothetical protein n=1 Tax=uncultured Sphingomonas sp. TaxID=158754 RepID=UPI0035CC881C
MDRDFWNSGAAIARLRDGAMLAVGRLDEMVERFLALPAWERENVALIGDAIDDPLGAEAVRALGERKDFPVFC